jgi:hypothetical protein
MVEERDAKRLPNPDAVGWPQDGFSDDLGHGRERIDVGDASEETRSLAHHEALDVLDRVGDEAAGIVVLRDGTRLQQGSTYVDLARLDDGPFVALGGERVGDGQLIVSKRRVAYDTWNALVGRDAEPRTMRPETG